MSVALPIHPQPAEAAPAYLDWGGTLRPIFGGAMQKLNRLGDRYALDVTMPPLDNEDHGRAWIAALVVAQRQGAILPWPQPGLVVGAPGAPVVAGAGQAGSTLLLRGFSAGYRMRAGQFVSLIVGGRRYLHMAAAVTVAAGNGTMALPIAPMLRARPGDGALVEVAAPMIEGLLEGDSRGWTLDAALYTGLSFRIVEAK